MGDEMSFRNNRDEGLVGADIWTQIQEEMFDHDNDFNQRGDTMKQPSGINDHEAWAEEAWFGV